MLKIIQDTSHLFRTLSPFKVRLSFVLILVFFSVRIIHAQPSPIQSLRHSLAGTNEDTTKVLILYELANTLIFTKPDTAIYYALDADSISSKINFTKGQVLALNSLGNAHWAKGNLKEGLSYYIQSKELAREIGDANLIAKNIGSMGLIYRAAGNYKAALAYYREALPLFYELNNQERIAVTYNNMGKCFLEMGQYDSASYYFTQIYPIVEESRPSMVPTLTFNHADVFFRQKDFAKAKAYLEKSSTAAQQFNDERMTIRSKQMLAEVMLWQGNIEEAETLATEAVAKAEATTVKELMYICYETLSHVHAQKNNFDQAYHFLGLYNSYKDSIQKEDIQERLDFMDFEQQQKEILLLTKEREIEKQMSEKQKIYIYVLSFLVVIIAILAIVLYRGRHRKSADNKLLQLKNGEIYRQKEEMSAQAEKLQNLNQLKTKLFSIISHDLRSPLNTLSGSLYLVQNGLIDREDFKAFLPELIKNVSYTTTLLDNLLHWAKNQLDGTEINPEKVNLKNIATLKTELLQNQADHKNIRLINKIQHEIYVYADEIMIQIVLQNLLSNAIKFCRSGDQVTLSWEHQGKYVNICVKDTGMGMDQEMLEKLFNSTSFSTRGTANEKGTGLGLLLCKDFVEKNGGRIWVESTLGQGSTFCFSLELYHQQTDPQPLIDQR